MSAHSEASKLYFKTGLKPSEAQFAQFIDWLRFTDQLIDFNDLTAELQAQILTFGRTVLLPAGTFIYNAPAGTLIEKFFIGDRVQFHSSAIITYTIRIGITPGGNELFDDTIVDTTNDLQSGILAKDYYCPINTTIYFTSTPTVGEPNNPIIKIYKS